MGWSKCQENIHLEQRIFRAIHQRGLLNLWVCFLICSVSLNIINNHYNYYRVVWECTEFCEWTKNRWRVLNCVEIWLNVESFRSVRERLNVLETRIVSNIQNVGSYQLPDRLIAASNIIYAYAGIIRVQECNSSQLKRFDYSSYKS